MDNCKKKNTDKERHFKLFQGATFLQPIKWEYSDGSPINITDYIIKWQIRPSATSSTITVSGDYEITDAKEGLFLIKLSAEKTSLIPTKGNDYSKLSKYVYDVQMISPTGVVSRLLHGFVLISPEVTK